MTEVQMGRRKRNRYEVIRDILTLCENGVKKTWLMYKANLSYEATRNYIVELAEKELIVQKDGLYYLTDKGRKLLDLLKDYKDKKDKKLRAQIKEIYGED